MKNHTFVISADIQTTKSKVSKYLQEHPLIIDFAFRAFKDKTVLKVKSDDNLRIHQIKNIIYTSGCYVKPLKGVFAKFKNTMQLAVL